MTGVAECRSWSYYHAKVAPLFAGALDEPLWSRLIPQLAPAHGGIRYAIFAISASYEYRQHSTIMNIHQHSEQYVQALQWHARALSAHEIPSLHDQRKIALVMCGLLSAFEFQQNNFKGGLRLLRVIFTLVAPLLTAGYNPDAMIGDEILETILPVSMRNAGLLFTAWDGLDAEILPQAGSEDLETAVFRALCTTYALLKDTYLAYKSQITSSFEALLTRHEEIRTYLRLYSDQAESLLIGSLTDTVRNHRFRAIIEYCSISFDWLSLMTNAAASTSDCTFFLTSVLDHLKLLFETSLDTHPAAASTKYFKTMTITPVAYFIAVFASNAQLRNQALVMMDYPTMESPKTQLHAIVTSLERGKPAQVNSSRKASQADLAKGTAAPLDEVLFSRTQLLPAHKRWVKNQENIVFHRANIDGPYSHHVHAAGSKTWIGADINGAYKRQVHHFS